ncbi:MAG: preprotein translocase subunit SecE [Halanaerobiales bacterium]|nr:preprotein translocase subunit SecE [Halanaerobiales bacterium]
MAKLGFLGKFTGFLKKVRLELRKVNWPSKNDLQSYTIVVLITVTVLITFIGIIDLGLSNLITPFIM